MEKFSVKQDGIEFYYDRPLIGGAHIETDVHPGFMTDWQQPFSLLLTQATNASVIHETVYESRFGYIHTLKQMGADIDFFTKCLGRKPCRFALQNHHHSIVIKGGTKTYRKRYSYSRFKGRICICFSGLNSERNL